MAGVRADATDVTDAAGDGEDWIRRFHPAPRSRVRLVCLPHAGGSASFYHPFSAALSPEVEVLAVQYPGRQDRLGEEPISDIGRLADAVCRAVLPETGRPFALFGHSMGAVLAYETARRLAARGAPAPAVLFVSGRRAPSRHREETVHLRDDAGVLAELRKLGGSDTRLLDDPEIVAMVLPAVRGDYTAIETYRHRPGPPLASPLVALMGDADPRTTPEDVRAWEDHTEGAFATHVFPGGHFFLNDQRDGVLGVITKTLRRLGLQD
ncbi:thioesterase II family protein [Streptomyces sp. 6N223]|uniref:thioesterase II family protein n=1 Tax=Streptomyces sp. 6N223 TaxID=3457412 RepID=UPI003FD6ADF7